MTHCGTHQNPIDREIWKVLSVAHPRRVKAIILLLSGPISRDIAIVSLRYPLSRDTFSAIAAIPQQGAIPPLGDFFYTDISVRYPVLQHIARYLRDTPRKQARKGFAILSLKVSRDMKSIVAGPLGSLGLKDIFEVSGIMILRIQITPHPLWPRGSECKERSPAQGCRGFEAPYATPRFSNSASFGDWILYTTTVGGKNRHGHFDAPPSTSGV